MSLIITYGPRNGESGIGYYRRLGADNSIFNWHDLASMAGVEPNRRSLMSRASDVARNLGLDVAFTEFAAKQESSRLAWGRLHRAKSEAVCPACLSESPHLRHHWEHAYVTACPQHQIMLVDECNSCGEPLSPERLYIGLCSCGHKLTELPQTPATFGQLWLSTLISENGRCANGTQPLLENVDIDAFVKVIRTLCQHANPQQPALPRGSALPKRVAEAVSFLAPLEAMLMNWPMGFHHHVKERIAAGKPGARTLNSLLGDWYISLRKLCQRTTLEPLLQVIIDVAATQSDCVLGLDSAKHIATDSTGYMRAPDVAKAIGVSVSRLHESIAAGECEHRTRRTGTRGQLFELPCAEVERIQERRSEWITDDLACHLAGVSAAVLARMKASSVIQSDVRWREDLLKGGPVNRQSIIELYDRIVGRSQTDAVDSDSTISWATLTSRRMGDHGAIEMLMQAIAEGKVPCVARGRCLGELSFLKADVSRYFGTPLLEAGMSIQQLSKVTGWKWESISHWIDEGLLESQPITLRGQSCRVVLPPQLLAFRQKFIPLSDLAQSMGTKSSALSRHFSRVELVGAKELPGGAKRGGLIRVSDLCQLALIGARAGHDLFVPAQTH